ncbi:MAG: RCC1 domain-containing protein [Janthinobacterium lividum]
MRALRWLLLLLPPVLVACVQQSGSDSGPSGRPLLGPLKLHGFGSRVAVGANLVVVIREDGTLWAWGDNRLGQVGIHRTTLEYDYVTCPALVDAGHDWYAVAAGEQHCLALRRDGTLWAWGPNNEGALGTGPDIALLVGASAPVQVGTATDWVAVAAGRYHSLARRADGSLWSWGDNNSAQLGNLPWPGPDPAWYNVPRRVGPAAARWATFAGGGTMTLAVRADGTLYSWGGNDTDQLGRPGLDRILDEGKTGVYSHPEPVPGGLPWRRVAAGWGFGVGIRRDGSLWVWGNDSSLTRIKQPHDTTWVKLAAGSSHCLALRRDGSLWAWGSNSFGQLGTGNTDDPELRQFVQVGSGQQWRDMAAGRDTSVGLQADGSFWLWGENGVAWTAERTEQPAPYLRPTRVVFPPAPSGNQAAF